MSAVAAAIVAGKVRERPEAVFLLPSGTTPLGMYRRLVKMHHREVPSLARTIFFNLDEYLGLPSDELSRLHGRDLL